jgi:hypothetical protein
VRDSFAFQTASYQQTVLTALQQVADDLLRARTMRRT